MTHRICDEVEHGVMIKKSFEKMVDSTELRHVLVSPSKTDSVTVDARVGAWVILIAFQ